VREFVLSDFDFELPDRLIAQHPLATRSSSRLLDGSHRLLVDRIFVNLPQLLTPQDLLVLNDTEVVRARLFGQKPTGGAVELLVERVLADGLVVAHFRASKKPPVGTRIQMHGGFTAELLGRWPEPDGQLFKFAFANAAGDNAYALMATHGHMPLPPYIDRADATADDARYQTVFAKNPGAVAAPTAALHFDQALLDTLHAQGVETAHVTLHVGAGTFMPVKTEVLAQHTMHLERYSVPAGTLAAIDRCKKRGGRVVAIGTTTVRTLESWAASGLSEGDTGIFITPGFEFKVVDALVTNFHLPKSTLMMLVSAFAGHEKIREMYRHAIAQNYRFFSYGDAMFLVRSDTRAHLGDTLTNGQ
jgi:S-adenosylmethionine:tRNA ribosyltransferase-isomerase